MHLPVKRTSSTTSSGRFSTSSRPLAKSGDAKRGARGGKHRLAYRSLQELRERILPTQTERYFNSADGLYRVVQLGLRANLPAEVLPAAVRLAEIDHIPERAQVCHALVLRKLGKHEEALQVLNGWLTAHPDSRLALTHVSGIYTLLGKTVEAEKAMRKALALHQGPALAGALDQLDDLVGGEVAYLDEERRRALLTCGWHPSLWHARIALRGPDRQAVIDRYRHFLNGIPAEEYGNALCIVAADLSLAQGHGMAIELITPRYIVGQHSALVGVNLLASAIETQQQEQAVKLLAQLRLRFHDILPNHLNHLADRLEHLGDLPLDGPGSAAITLIDSPHPLWWLYTAKPAWLLKSAQPDAWGVTYLISAQHGEHALSIDPQTISSFALGAQLYLRDTFALRYGPSHRALIAVRPKIGMAELREPWAADEIRELGDDLAGSRWAVTGVLSNSATRITLLLQVLDSQTGKTLLSAELSEECSEQASGGVVNEDLGRLMLQAVTRLQAFYRSQGLPDAQIESPVALTRDPQQAFTHLTAHARLCRLVLAYQRTIPILNPQIVLAWFVRQAELFPQDAHLRLLAYCALLADAAAGSLLYTEFKHRVLKLVNDTDASDHGCASLAPLMVALYAADAFATDGAPVEFLRDPQYRAWMAALEQQQSMVLVDDDDLLLQDADHEALESA